MDGTDLPRKPFTGDAPVRSTQIHVLIGSNKDEMTIMKARDPNLARAQIGSWRNTYDSYFPPSPQHRFRHLNGIAYERSVAHRIHNQSGIFAASDYVNLTGQARKFFDEPYVCTQILGVHYMLSFEDINSLIG